MSLLDSLTSPNWQHKNPQIRKDAVVQLDDQDVLLDLIKTDPDASVQAAALARIDRPDILDALIETLPQALQQQARDQRLQQLLPEPGKLASITDDALLVRIINLTGNPDLITNALEHISNHTVRMDLAVNHSQTKVRLSAARSISDIELLSELMQRSRGHDKAVYRHCKTLVDEHHAEQLAAVKRQEQIQQLTEKVKELTTAVDSPDYESRYRVLARNWQAVKTSASPEQELAFQRDQALCAQRLVLQADARAAEVKAQTDLAAASQVFPAIIAELEQIDTAAALPADKAAITQLKATLDEIETRWQAGRKVAPTSPQQSRTCEQFLASWRSMLQTLQHLLGKDVQLNKIRLEAEKADPSDYHALLRQIERAQKLVLSLPWPEAQQARLPEKISQLQQALTQLRKQLDILEKDQPKFRDQLQTLVENLRTELEQDHSKEAGRLLIKARRVLRSVAPKQRQHFEQKIHPLAARLEEVHDWQDFAIEPKKVALCANMTALIGSEEDIEMLAVKIKSYQDEWKQLGALPNAREHALWNEFKAAADEAWKPCKAAMVQQALQQQKNFEKRMELVTQLTEYEEKMAWPIYGDEQAEPGKPVSGSAPDWRMVQKTLDTARAAFRQINPVGQKADRKSHKSFQKICDRIYDHIKQEYEYNIARKERLVTRVGELASVEDLPQAIDTCKKLQQEWKRIGVTPVAVDRKLWKKFRSSCDAVFARLDEQRTQNEAESKAQVKQAESLRDQARALLASKNAEQALHLNKALAELKQQLQCIQLPASVQQRLTRDFHTMETQAREKAVEVRNDLEKASWALLSEKIKACALKTTDEETATRLWLAEGEVPKGIDTDTLETFWQNGPSEDSEEQLREACIALEVLGAIESPAEDKKARMNYQMKRLVEGMGSRIHQPEQDQMSSINAFISLRPSTGWAERFCSALEKIRG